MLIVGEKYYFKCSKDSNILLRISKIITDIFML